MVVAVEEAPQRRRLTMSLWPEWATAVGLGKNTVYALARQNRVPGLIRISDKRLVVSVPAFQRWIESGGALD